MTQILRLLNSSFYHTEGDAESTSSRPTLSLQGREDEKPRKQSVIMIITLFKS